MSDSQAELIAQLQEENASLKSQLGEPDLKAFEQIKELRSTNKRLTDEVKRLTGEGVQLAFKNRQLDQQAKKLQQESTEAIARLQGEMDEAVGKLQQELAAITARSQQLDHSVEELQGELTQSRERVLSHEAELARQKEELSQRQQNLAQLQAELSTREGRISKLEQLVTDFKEQFLSGDDFEATAAAAHHEGNAYQLLMSHVDLALGLPGRTLVDQVYELMELDKGCQDLQRLEELFDALQDTGSQLFSEEQDQAALKQALGTAWQAIGGGGAPATRSAGTPEPATAPLGSPPEPGLSKLGLPPSEPPASTLAPPPAEPPPAELSVSTLAPPPTLAEPPAATAPPSEEPPAPTPSPAEPPASTLAPPPVEPPTLTLAPPPAEPPTLTLAPPPAEPLVPTLEPPSPESPGAQGLPTLPDEPPASAVPALTIAPASSTLGPPPALEDEPTDDLSALLDMHDEEEAAAQEPEPEAEPEAPELEPQATLPEPQPETAAATEEAWAPAEAAAKFEQIAAALPLVAGQPDQAMEMLKQALEVEIWVENEAKANLALARIKANQEDIVPYLNEALGGTELPDLFTLLSAAESTASGTIQERLGLFYQFGMTPRADMAKQEGALGMGKRGLNRDFVSQLGNEEEEEIVTFLRENLMPKAGLELPVPSRIFEERLESTGPAAFVGTLRQALRAVDYTLFDFPELKVLTYDGPDQFLVDASAEPDLTLVFHRDIEGMPPEELCFLVFRHLVRMYRGHSQLAHQSSALTDSQRLQLAQAAVELYLEEGSVPHASLMDRLQALQAGEANFESDCRQLMLHWYQATNWAGFLYMREFAFGDEVFRKRLDPVADHAAARLVGITAATYGSLREELLSQPEVLEEVQEGLQELFEHTPGVSSTRYRIQRMWNEFLLEEE